MHFTYDQRWSQSWINNHIFKGNVWKWFDGFMFNSHIVHFVLYIWSSTQPNIWKIKYQYYSISINNIKIGKYKFWLVFGKFRPMVFFVKSFVQKLTSRKKNHTDHSKALVASSGLFFSNSRYLGDSGQNGKVINWRIPGIMVNPSKNGHPASFPSTLLIPRTWKMKIEKSW